VSEVRAQRQVRTRARSGAAGTRARRRPGDRRRRGQPGGAGPSAGAEPADRGGASGAAACGRWAGGCWGF
jgi:hypothetical protein